MVRAHMTGHIVRSSEQLVSHVQAVVREHVPGANCQVIDYGKRIGCGELDKNGKLHEARWIIDDLEDDQVVVDARQMAKNIGEANRRIQTDC